MVGRDKHVRVLDLRVWMSHAVNHPERIIPWWWALKSALVRALLAPTHIPNRRYPFYLFPSNEGLAQNDIENANQRLINNFNEIFRLTNNQPLIFVRDNCITNDWIIRSLKSILWDSLVNELVSEVYVDFKRPTMNSVITKMNKDAIIMIWWSRTNIFEIHNDWVYWKFADIILESLSDHPSTERNNCLLWICHWQNYFLHLINLLNSDSRNFLITNKWPAHFWPAHLKIWNLRHVSTYVRNAMNWLTNFGKNTEFTWVCTRSSKNDFDILNTGIDSWLNILAKDELTWDPLMWATNNGRCIWSYIHPEVRFISEPDEIKSLNASLVEFLKSEYWEKEAEAIKYNYDWIENFVKNEIDIHFYTYVLLSLSQLIIDNIRLKKKIRVYWSLSQSDDLWKLSLREKLEYWTATNRFLQMTKQRLFELLEWNDVPLEHVSRIDLNDPNTQKDYLSMIDKSWLLQLNARYWRIVNRWIKAVSREFCVKDISKLFEDVVDHVIAVDWEFSDINVVRDLWCWNWTFIKELNDKKKESWKFKEKNLFFQWVSREIPFELLQWMLSSKIAENKKIPYDILEFLNILIVQKYKFNSEITLEQQISQIISELPKNWFDRRYLKFNSDDWYYYHHYSMPFYKDVFRPMNLSIRLSHEWYIFLTEKIGDVLELLYDIKDNVYNYFWWYVERILVNSFENMKIGNLELAKSAVSISTKWTSQIISPRWYLQVLEDFVVKFSRPWSVFFDNWVMASYTSISRIQELKRLTEKYDNIKVKLIYDKYSNYFVWAIIMKKPYFDVTKIEEQLLNSFEDSESWYRADAYLVDLDDAYNCSYVKWERFVRDYLLSTFRSYDVFWSYKQDISDFLQSLPERLKNLENSDDYSRKEIEYDIKLEFVKLVNAIALDLDIHIRENKPEILVEYNPIDINMLESYQKLDTKENIDDLLKAKSHMPDWFNMSWKRKFQ